MPTDFTGKPWLSSALASGGSPQHGIGLLYAA
jgi:hypothetical protein